MKKILALPGSQREASTNKALLHLLQKLAPEQVSVDIYADIGNFPIFNPDREGDNMPPVIESFINQVLQSDGLIIACPEYAHGIPGGFKNALDWLVSVDGFAGMPVMIAHASHRGGFLLSALQEVLKAMDTSLVEEAFLRVPVMGKTPQEVEKLSENLDISTLIKDRMQTFANSITEKIKS